MTTAQKQRLKFVIFFALSLSLGSFLIFQALRQNMMYFYKPSDLNKSYINQKIRLGGQVKIKSLKQNSKTFEVSFKIQDQLKEIEVKYQGILPDLFREGQWIIAEGKMISLSNFKADLILAKHDENYRPKNSDKLSSVDISENFKKNQDLDGLHG